MPKIAIGTVDSDPIEGSTVPERVFENEDDAERFMANLNTDSGRYYWAYIGEDEWYHPLTREGLEALKEAVGARGTEGYELLPSGNVFDHIEGCVLAGCECDNTHQQNDTVCRYCWAHGRRKWDDPEVSTPLPTCQEPHDKNSA